MNEFLNYLNTLLSDVIFLSVLTIVISVLGIGISITSIILVKKTNERDNARIAQEEQQRLAKASK